MSQSTDIASLFDNDKNFQAIMKHLLTASMEASFNGVTITTAEPGYPIVYVNPAFCEITGYRADELLGKSPSMFQGPDTDKWVLDELKEKIVAGELFHGKTTNYRKDGSDFTMEWNIVPIRGAAGEISHYLAIQREAMTGA